MDFDTTEENIKLDKEYIKKVFVNLLLNAIQAIENSGSVKITTNKTNLSKTVSDYASLLSKNQDELQSVTVQKLVLKKGEPVVVIEISDSGQGIPKDHIAKIFDTFFTTKVNGTGLGLSFVKRVINAHDGIITVHSEHEKGTTFTIYLPLKDQSNHEKK